MSLIFCQRQDKVARLAKKQWTYKITFKNNHCYIGMLLDKTSGSAYIDEFLLLK